MGSISLNEQLHAVSHSDPKYQAGTAEQSKSQSCQLATEAVALEVILLSWFLVLLRTREDVTEFAWRPESLQDYCIIDLTAVTADLHQPISKALAAVRKSITSAFDLQADSINLSSSRAPLNSEDSVEIRVRDLLSVPTANIVHQAPSVLEFTSRHSLEALADLVKPCLSSPHLSIRDALRPTAHDLDAIWQWNATVPPTYSHGMHEIFTDQAARSSDKIALNSWDGDLTYGQIEQYSTNIATTLVARGVLPDDIVPICSEKSKWATVAVLSVMKAGATFVLMDPTLPLVRLQNMAQQVRAKIMVSTDRQYDLSRSILPGTDPMIVNQEQVTIQRDVQLPQVSPSTIMYIIFTSGSTGTPKGVQISHQTYSSSAFPRAETVGYNEESRVLDFASYAFDVSIDSMLLTLCNGGCLCIPSDEDRLNDVNRVIREMKINYPGLTPSVARILDDDVISSLHMLGLGGEAVAARDVNLWGKVTRIVIGYGPCECTIGCTVNGDAATGRNYISIGKGNGANMWIVDPDDHDMLVPFGAIGELLVEGPIVGQGYLNDPEKTASVFIEDPKWLTAGHAGHTGRRGRLYKTGDLGKYDPDGSGEIVFVGRKDTQVKLRGQRVELGEIESQLKDNLPSTIDVVAEVISTNGPSTQPMLVAFIASAVSKKDHTIELSLQDLEQDAQERLSAAEAAIAKSLPRYMVPSAFIPINQIPVLISGKTDRKKLREFGTQVDLRLVESLGTQDEDTAPDEKQLALRSCWAQLLNVEASKIRGRDNFFSLGGDSVRAMKLVTVCRNAGLLVSVRDTFDHPTLASMSEVVQTLEDGEQLSVIEPFTLVTNRDKSVQQAASICYVPVDTIQDIYPCSATQESLFTFSLKASEPYTAQRVSLIPSHIETIDWQKAWNTLVASFPILRTRVVQLDDSGLLQVVLDESVDWKASDDLKAYLESDKATRMELGSALARYAIVHDKQSAKRYMVWTIHHVVYDGWSEPLLLQQVKSIMDGGQVSVTAHMNSFVQFVTSISKQEQVAYWKEELDGANGPQYPLLPSRDYLPTAQGFTERHIDLRSDGKFAFTVATLVRAAWALVASQHTANDDVVFGETLSGRDIALAAVEDISGPLIATVPFRIKIDRLQSVEDYLRKVQEAMLSRIQYQHMGMQNIRKVSNDAQFACETGTGIVIQPAPAHIAVDLGFELGDPVREALHFNPYPLMLAFGLQADGIRVCANFDKDLIDVDEMERVLQQLQTACTALSRDPTRTVGEISCLPQTEIDRIRLFADLAVPQLENYATQSDSVRKLLDQAESPKTITPRVCSSANPQLPTPIGCVGDLWLEGTLNSDSHIQVPVWIVGGSPDREVSSRRLHATGDIVRLQSDGSLVHVGRKENIVLIDGHSLDLVDLNARIQRHIASKYETSVVILPPGAGQSGNLSVAVHDSTTSEQSLSLQVNASINTAAANIAGESSILPCAVSIELLRTLRKLDRHLRDAFPSYMVPSVYIPTTRQVKSSELISFLDDQTAQELKEKLPNLWMSVGSDEDHTEAEQVLISAWSAILRIDTHSIDVEDNFFRKGGDSVLAMKLSAYLRNKGYSLTVADIFKNMRLQLAAKVMRHIGLPEADVAQYKPYSTLSPEQLEFVASGGIDGLLQQNTDNIQDVLPVTYAQKLDIEATISGTRTSYQFTLLFFGAEVDLQKLRQAIDALIDAHDILRTVFIKHKFTFLQVVLRRLEISIVESRTDEDLREHIDRLCQKEIEDDFVLGSTFLRLYHVIGCDGQHCLVLGLSHAMYDGVSLPAILQHLETLYLDQTIPDCLPLSHYIAQTQEKSVRSEAVQYWRQLLQGSALSGLDRISRSVQDKSVFLEQSLGPLTQPENITVASVLTAAWATLLSRRLATQDVTFGNITSGRAIGHKYLENVVGPCYQFTPVRIKLQEQWNSLELLEHIQRQSAESAAHDFLGYDTIAQQCTDWPAASTFDSIVHHQDMDDIESMPFAGTQAGIDIRNPHGDAAHPFKAVSFVRKGALHLGVVASQADSDFATKTLSELVMIVHQLTASA